MEETEINRNISGKRSSSLLRNIFSTIRKGVLPYAPTGQIRKGVMNHAPTSSQGWLFIIWAAGVCLIWISQYVKYLFESQGVLMLVQEKGIWALVVRFFTIGGS